MGDIIQLNQAETKLQLKDLVRATVEEKLNKLPDEEANRITNAHRYERNEERQDTRAGHYTRKLLTTSGEVNLKVPNLRVLQARFILCLGREGIPEHVASLQV